ncbi:MAG TPA: FAD-dependent oxidoreductase [Bauldia sp.]|nr:FAD-dependent oxidoreductase [Bauldia sp.]
MALDDEIACDVLVVGSGAAGLSAAVACARKGLDVLLIEKEAVVGGTSALSGGWLWVPGNAHAARAGISDTLDAARAYLRHEMGNRYDAARVDAFLDNGAAAVAFFEAEAGLKFTLGVDYPDYHSNAPGGASGGRALCPEPFDGLQLGAWLKVMRPPPPELTLFGIKVGSGPDFRHFANAQRSLHSAMYVAGRIVAHARDLLLHGRDVRLMSGAALVARLLKAAVDAGVRIWLSCPLLELVQAGSDVGGAIVSHERKQMRVTARRGVVLAAGGFSHDRERRRVLLGAAAGGEIATLSSPGNTGDGLTAAEQVGGVVDASLANPAAWMPLSRVTRRDGAVAFYPHNFDRGKPGVFAVKADGRRFANESGSYHDLVEAMIAARRGSEEVCAYLICDGITIRRYGLGIAKPFPVPLWPYLQRGYLHRGQTIEELARHSGIDPKGLAATVAEINAHAPSGRDPQFGRGSSAYDAYTGDRHNKPNPSLAPVAHPPFYSVKIYPGDLNTFDGLKTDATARVLDSSGRPIGGLYAVGADMASVFGGHYPGPGINLGPAITFAYLAANDLAQRTEAGREVR